jgi:hypothetical protein
MNPKKYYISVNKKPADTEEQMNSYRSYHTDNSSERSHQDLKPKKRRQKSALISSDLILQANSEKHLRAVEAIQQHRRNQFY